MHVLTIDPTDNMSGIFILDPNDPLDMQKQIQILNHTRNAEADRAALAKAAGKESFVDPDRTFTSLPSFLNESYNLGLKSFHQRLTLLLRCVPTSDAQQVTRKLQAAGYPKIANLLRAILQQEEAQHVSRRPQSRGVTVSSSRPGTAASLSLQYNSRLNLIKLAESLQQNPSAVTILIEKKPRPTERDREQTTGRIVRWHAPQRNNRFIDYFHQVVEYFAIKVARSNAENNWYANIVSHQEDRGTHAKGDQTTLIASIKKCKRSAREHFLNLDRKIKSLTKQVQSASGACELETDFENDVQETWQNNCTSTHDTFITDIVTTENKIDQAIDILVLDHKSELKLLRRKIERRTKEYKEQKVISDQVMLMKNTEIEQIKEDSCNMNQEMEKLRKEIKDMEWIQKKDEELAAKVQAVIDIRVSEYEVIDREKQKLKEEAAKQLEEERLRLLAEELEKNPPKETKQKKRKK